MYTGMEVGAGRVCVCPRKAAMRGVPLRLDGGLAPGIVGGRNGGTALAGKFCFTWPESLGET